MVKAAFEVYRKKQNRQNNDKQTKFKTKKQNTKTKLKIKRIKPIKVELKKEVPIKKDVKLKKKQADKVKNLHSQSSKDVHKELFIDLPEETFSYLISPIIPNDFFSNYWEKNCLHIVRKNQSYFKDFFSSKKLDDILRNNPLYYTRNIDVVTYENGERKTHNPEGRAVPASVWDYYSNGCSVRLLNPQTYNKKVRSVLAALQEYFGTMAGANVYLTPPGSQGFAPHYDDIEAFVLQIEGRKHWKIYKPNINDTLARYSSKNFARDELKNNIPIEVTVKAGDLLYFPRGYIHEACTDEDSHSLHITVSVYQNTCYADLIEKCLMGSLKQAAASDVEFRRGLPIQYLKHLGTSNLNGKSTIRTQIINMVKNLVGKLSQYISVDDGADQLGRKFMYDSLPPQLLPDERIRSCKDDGDVLVKGKVENKGVFEPDTSIRLVRYHSIRLVFEDDIYKLYYNTENADVYHGEEEQFLQINEDMVETVKTLLKSYPDYKKIEDLPNRDQVGLMHAIGDLWERGLIVTKTSLTVYDD